MRSVIRCLALIVIGINALLTSQCMQQVEGSGEVTETKREVKAFQHLKSTGIFDLVLTNGDGPLTIEADSNLLPHIQTTVEDQTLQIKSDRDIRDPEKLQITIPVGQLNGLTYTGTGTVKTRNKLTGDSLQITNTGTSSIALKLGYQQVHFENNGTGTATLTGQAEDLTVEQLGTGAFDAEGLKAGNVSVSLAGTADCRLHATETLSVDATGTGTIHYKGDPTIEKVSTNFSRSLERIE